MFIVSAEIKLTQVLKQIKCNKKRVLILIPEYQDVACMETSDSHYLTCKIYKNNIVL